MKPQEVDSDFELRCRLACIEDLKSIIELLADDELGAQREVAGKEPAASYQQAFAAIQQDPNNELLVAEYNQHVVAVLQLTFTPNLSHQGSWRATIEGVRVASRLRSHGFGTRLMEMAIDRARQRGCRLVQLTSNSQRTSAIRFYERLGFEHTHAGMKMWLPVSDASG